MATFKVFKTAIQKQMDLIINDSPYLFEVEVDKDEMWNLYLDSFPPGTNEIFRERREYDCHCCKQFIRNAGNIVGIIGGEIHSIWDVQVPEPFQTVANVLKEYITSRPVSNIYCYDSKNLGTDTNNELIGDNVHTWNHFYYQLPDKYIANRDESIETRKSKYRQTKEVIARSVEEITPSAIETVLDLIEDNNLYRGKEHEPALKSFQEVQRGWITVKNKENYCWITSVNLGRFAAIRNTAIGTLLVDLSDGKDLMGSVASYENKVSGTNYKRPKPIYTKKMLKDAEDKVEELGLTNSLPRRHACLEDISRNNVLWASADSAKVMKSAFDELAEDITVNPDKFKNVREMGIGAFVRDVLPTANKIEMLVENRLEPNFMSLITAVNQDSPTLFKWNNSFSWTYKGGVADSIKEAVKRRGGNVEGFFRASLRWAEGDPTDNSDLDLHVVFPNGHVYFSASTHIFGLGTMAKLDVDIQRPNYRDNKDIVENIIFTGSMGYIPQVEYEVYVKNFALRGKQKGFSLEIEFDGQLYEFTYSKPLRQGEIVSVAKVKFDGKHFKITKSLPHSSSSKTVWGVNTSRFVPVTAIMYSPNYWDEQTGIGNRHYFFTLEECSNTDDEPRGFYNEFLRNDLNELRKVFEALGSKMKVQPNQYNTQLSGVGFSDTKDNYFTVRINDSLTYKIKITDEELVANRIAEEVQV